MSYFACFNFTLSSWDVAILIAVTLIIEGGLAGIAALLLSSVLNVSVPTALGIEAFGGLSFAALGYLLTITGVPFVALTAAAACGLILAVNWLVNQIRREKTKSGLTYTPPKLGDEQSS